MESDKNFMPEFKLFQPLERLRKVAHFLFDHITSEGLSDHNRGGGPALDAALYDSPAEQLQIDFESQADRGW